MIVCTEGTSSRNEERNIYFKNVITWFPFDKQLTMLYKYKNNFFLNLAVCAN